jgi:Glycosyltransferase
MTRSKEIKVFVDAHVFDGEYQGTRTFIRGIYTILATYPGIKLFIGGYNVEQLKLNFPENENVFFVKYRFKSSFLRLTLEIPSIIRKHKIEYGHFQYIVPLIKNCKFIVTTHDLLFLEFPDQFPFAYRITKRILFEKSLLRSDIITTVSNYSGSSIQKFLKIKKDKIYITPNGIDSRYFEDYNKDKSSSFIKSKYRIDKYILYVSRIEPRKNHLSLLKAYLEERLFEKNIFLVFLGHESIKVPELNKILLSLSEGIRKCIIIKYDVPDDDLIEFYRGAELFVYPSLAEGFGIPPIEAAACKIPVLCSNETAMKDFSFFNDGLFDPLNITELKTKINRALDRPNNSEYLESISLEVKKRYSWDVSAKKIYELLISNSVN